MKELVGKTEDELMDIFDAELGDELNTMTHMEYVEKFTAWLKGHGLTICRW